jgi:hypothetical protein
MDDQIYGILERVAGEEDAARRAQMMAESNERLGDHFGRVNADLDELAFDLFNAAWGDAVNDSVLQRVIEVKSVGLGEQDKVEEDLRGVRAYWQGKGGQIRSDILRYERTYMPREEMVAALDFHQDELALDFWGNFGRLQRQARDKFRSLPVERLVELVRAAIVAGDYFGQFAASTLTSDQFEGPLEHVAARSGGNVSIVGTRIALRALAKIGLEYGDNISEQVFRTGEIGGYKGYPAVQVENYEDMDGNFVLPDDELWLVGRNSGRLTYYGSSAKVQIIREKSFMQRWESARDAGMLLYGVGRGRIGRVKLV